MGFVPSALDVLHQDECSQYCIGNVRECTVLEMREILPDKRKLGHVSHLRRGNHAIVCAPGHLLQDAKHGPYRA